MWNFTSSGGLMPSMAPLKLADPKFTHDGKFELQVRARERSHITDFVRDYMDEGTYSDIEETAGMDYQYRFYTTREAYGEAMKRCVLDIDYVSFKHTAEDKNADGTPKYGNGKRTHDAFMRVWSAWHGIYGGYWEHDKATGVYGPKKYTYKGKGKSSGAYVPSSFGKVEEQGSLWDRWGGLDDRYDDYTSDDYDRAVARLDARGYGMHVEDYTTSDEAEADVLYQNYRGLTPSEIREWCSAREVGLLMEYYPGIFEPNEKRRKAQGPKRKGKQRYANKSKRTRHSH